MGEQQQRTYPKVWAGHDQDYEPGAAIMDLKPGDEISKTFIYGGTFRSAYYGKPITAYGHIEKVRRFKTGRVRYFVYWVGPDGHYSGWQDPEPEWQLAPREEVLHATA